MIKYFLFLFFIPFFIGEMDLPIEQLGESNAIFKNVVVEGKSGEYVVKGEARTKIGTFFYTVEDGHYQYVDETKVYFTKKNSTGGLFEINIELPKENLPNNATLILNLYERDENGKVKNTLPVVLEMFYK